MRTATATRVRVAGQAARGAGAARRGARARHARACSARSSLTFALPTISEAAKAAARSPGRARSPSRACAPASSAQPPHDAAAPRDAAGSRRLRARRRLRRDARRHRASRRSAKPRARSSAKSARSPARDRTARSKPKACPPTPIVGTSGLERALDARLRGTPGGELLAGQRVLASAAAARRRTPCARRVSPAVQQAAVDRARRPARRRRRDCSPRPARSWPSRASAWTALQPPGSTFKMVTLTGVLAAHIATPHTRLPLRDLRDARRRQAEQRQRRGMRRLARTRLRRLLQLGVRAARRQARRAAPGRDGRTLRLQPRPRASPGAAESTLPAATQHPGRTRRRLDRDRPGRGAGQRRCRWRSSPPRSPTAGTARDRPSRPAAPPTAAPSVTSAAVARTVRRLMIGVVADGTGTSAAIPGVVVAGKTGTAELKTACSSSGRTRSRRSRLRRRGRSTAASGADSEASNTDAWFAAFAPGAAPAHRRRRAARQRRRRRRHGGARRPRGARSRPAGAVPPASVALDVELGRCAARPRPAGSTILSFERPVVERDGLDLEQQQRALRGAVGGDRVEHRQAPFARHRARRGRRSGWLGRARSACRRCPACRDRRSPSAAGWRRSSCCCRPA